MTRNYSAISILSILVGTVLEWYDFSLLAAMAPLISMLFFPSINPAASLLATFSVMASGFLVRPIGAAIFGHVGDRYGRTVALSMTILLMAVPTTLIGCLPTYHSVGIVAPVLLIILRLIQGFASSGEYPGAICYLTEIAPANRKGIWGSLSMFGVAGGILFGSLINAVLSAYLTNDDMLQWGWRIPFMIGMPLGMVGWYLRYYSRDSIIFEQARSAKQTLSLPIKYVLQANLLKLIIAIALFSLGTVTFYMGFVYITSYLISTHQLSLHDALVSNSIGTLVMILTIPVTGFLSDLIGRNKIMMMGAVLLFLSFYPIFQLFLSHQLLLGQCLLGLLIGIFVGPVAATVSEMFAVNVRYSGVALALNIGSSVFGGTCPMMAAFLVNHFGYAALPGIYPVLIACICVVAIYVYANSHQLQQSMANINDNAKSKVLSEA